MNNNNTRRTVCNYAINALKIKIKLTTWLTVKVNVHELGWRNVLILISIIPLFCCA